MLICRKICFAAIYAVLAQNLFCRDLRTFVWRKIYSEIVLVEKKGQISGMSDYFCIYRYGPKLVGNVDCTVVNKSKAKSVQDSRRERDHLWSNPLLYLSIIFPSGDPAGVGTTFSNQMLQLMVNISA